jgi:iron complex transport system permease protein
MRIGLLGNQDRSLSPYAGIVPVLAITLVVIAGFSIRLGAVTVEFADMASALMKRWDAPNSLNITERIFIEIRLPRALACILATAK